MTLTEFLLARIAEDEQLARDSICPCGGPACTIETGWYHEDELTARLGDDGEPARQAVHVLRWSPSRVLAECEAKRRIVEMYEGAMTASAQIEKLGDSPDGELMLAISRAAAVAVEAAVKLAAEPHADHPDYRDEWKP